jgi:hypothetical protein
MEFDLTDIDRSFAKVADAVALIKHDRVVPRQLRGPGGFDALRQRRGRISVLVRRAVFCARRAYRKPPARSGDAVWFDVDEQEEIIAAAVEKIEQDGTVDWSKIPAHEIMLLYANDHRWGPGQIHRFDAQEGRTLCGKSRAMCPGVLGLGDEEEITCRGCLRNHRTEIERTN